MKRTGLLFTLLALNLSLPNSGAAADVQLRGALSLLKGGSYYSSKVIDDGVIQLTDCKPFPGEAFRNTKAPFHCAPDGAGFRCTSEGTRDVIFVFHNHKECSADRQRNFDHEEQE